MPGSEETFLKDWLMCLFSFSSDWIVTVTLLVIQIKLELVLGLLGFN